MRGWFRVTVGWPRRAGEKGPTEGSLGCERAEKGGVLEKEVRERRRMPSWLKLGLYVCSGE